MPKQRVTVQVDEGSPFGICLTVYRPHNWFSYGAGDYITGFFKFGGWKTRPELEGELAEAAKYLTATGEICLSTEGVYLAIKGNLYLFG